MKELTTEVKQALLAPFQAAEVRVRTQPYTAAYVTARVVMTRLDEVMPWQWSFQLKGQGVIDENGVMHQDGILSIRHPDGFNLEFHDRGSAPKDHVVEDDRGNRKSSQSKQAKHAVSDCFKRCAVHVGVGRYLYEIQGVQSGRIPKPGLEKALAAVGYHGNWDDRHYGPIGGIREADLEDELDEPRSAVSTGAGDEAETYKPQNATEERPVNGHKSNGKSAASGPAIPESLPKDSVKINEEQRSKIIAAVERGGGSVDKTSFLNWLTKNTANNATELEDILAEDVDELIRKLDTLATKRKA